MRPPTYYLTFNDERMNIADWSKRTGLSPITIRWRLRKGWSVERTLTAKVTGRTRGPKPKKPFAPNLANDLPALIDYQRDMHAAHRQMTQRVRQFVRTIESQFADFRHQLDQAVAEHREQTYRGVVENIKQRPSDRINSVAQDRT